MSRIARLALGNPLYHSRIRAAAHTPALVNREAAAEMSLIPVRRLYKLETGKETPRPDEIAALSNLYGDPTLRHKFCLCSCPHGVYGLEGIRNARVSSELITGMAN